MPLESTVQPFSNNGVEISQPYRHFQNYLKCSVQFPSSPLLRCLIDEDKAIHFALDSVPVLIQQVLQLLSVWTYIPSFPANIITHSMSRKGIKYKEVQQKQYQDCRGIKATLKKRTHDARFQLLTWRFPLRLINCVLIGKEWDFTKLDAMEQSSESPMEYCCPANSSMAVLPLRQRHIVFI